MTEQQTVILDGNEACASVAYRLAQVITIYPITPSSTMAEWADQWKEEGRKNIWGTIPVVVEMPREGGGGRAVEGRGAEEQRGHEPGGRREAERRRGGWCDARRPAGGSHEHHVHLLSRPAADDSEHVQDRWRAYLQRDSRDRARPGYACTLDLWRPV